MLAYIDFRINHPDSWSKFVYQIRSSLIHRVIKTPNAVHVHKNDGFQWNQRFIFATKERKKKNGNIDFGQRFQMAKRLKCDTINVWQSSQQTICAQRNSFNSNNCCFLMRSTYYSVSRALSMAKSKNIFDKDIHTSVARWTPTHAISTE